MPRRKGARREESPASPMSLANSPGQPEHSSSLQNDSVTVCSICHSALPNARVARQHFGNARECREAGGAPVLLNLSAPQPGHELGRVTRSLLSGTSNCIE